MGGDASAFPVAVVTLAELQEAIESSWGLDTLYCQSSIHYCDYDWMEDMFNKNPAFGQCIVTALVVQDFFGGCIVKASDRSHWWNVTRDGINIDMTISQFDEDDREMVARDIWPRCQLLSRRESSVRDRYVTLRDRVMEKLACRKLG